MDEYAELLQLRSAAEPYLAGLPALPDDVEYRAFASGEHPHMPAGSPAGGQFAPKKGSGKSAPAHGHGGHSPAHHPAHGAGHPNDSGNFEFNGKTGPGYGMPGGSKKVKGLQAELVRLGFAPKNDKGLADGKYGPKTAAAVKKAQAALGMKADGIATPALMQKLAAMHQAPHHAAHAAHHAAHGHRSADPMLFRLPALPPEVRAVDTTPGKGNAAQLHQYWTKGEGLAKWAGSDHPWTSLYHHLLKYLNPEEAKRTAAEWFHDVFGFWPGSDVNRVTHGHPPRGHKVGPG